MPLQSGQVSRYTAYSALFDQPRTGLPLSCCFDRMISRRSLHRALLNCSSPDRLGVGPVFFVTVSDISDNCRQQASEPAVPVIARFYSTGRCVSVDMPVRPAHWLSSSCHILSDRLSAGFSCGLCSGRSAVPSSVQPADLLRPDSAALPVLPGNFRPAFFLNRATPTGGRIILTDCPWGIEQPLRFT